MSLLVATLAFDGPPLEEAKLGILGAALGAASSRGSCFVPRTAASARPDTALLGTDEPLIDLDVEVDTERDHIRGPIESPVTVVEYGDFECPYCGQAEPFVRELLREFGDVRYVWRHLPLNDVHPQAQLAAEAAEAAAEQGAFWAMHDLLLDHQDALRPADLIRYAEQLGLDMERFSSQLREQLVRTASPRTSTVPTSAESPAPRPSSSTAGATTARTIPPPFRPPSARPGRG